MAKKKKATGKPKGLTAGEKATLRKILAKVRRLPRKKKAADTTKKVDPRSQQCFNQAKSLKAAQAALTAIAARGLTTQTQIQAFNQQAANVASLTTLYQTNGCDPAFLI